jgi:hypothetical protein
MFDGKFNRDQFFFGISVVVEAGYHLPIRLVLGKRDIQLVTDPIKDDEADKQYGSSFPHNHR